MFVVEDQITFVVEDQITCLLLRTRSHVCC